MRNIARTFASWEFVPNFTYENGDVCRCEAPMPCMVSKRRSIAEKFVEALSQRLLQCPTRWLLRSVVVDGDHAEIVIVPGRAGAGSLKSGDDYFLLSCVYDEYEDGTVTRSVGDMGGLNPILEVKGGLMPFFDTFRDHGDGIPECILYGLLHECGADRKRIAVTVVTPADDGRRPGESCFDRYVRHGKEAWEAAVRDTWTVTDDIQYTDPKDKKSYRVTICSLGGKKVYMKTDLDNVDDPENITDENLCRVHFDLKAFLSGWGEDVYFADDEDNREHFLTFLRDAWEETAGTENRWNAFRDAAIEKIGHYAKPGWTQIFKQNPRSDDDPECGAPKVTDEEWAIIEAACPDYRYYEDGGNALFALDLYGLTRDDCDTLVTRLNKRLERYGHEGSWWLGHEDEEYVNVG